MFSSEPEVADGVWRGGECEQALGEGVGRLLCVGGWRSQIKRFGDYADERRRETGRGGRQEARPGSDSYYVCPWPS